MNLTKDTVSVIIPFEIKRVAKALLNVIEQGKGFKIKSKNELVNSYTESNFVAIARVVEGHVQM